MSNLLRDFLPDAPRESGLLIAAADASLADTLREHVSDGMDARTAISLSASSLALVTAYAPDVCEWVAAEFAVALGLVGPGEPDGGAGHSATSQTRGGARPEHQPTMTTTANSPVASPRKGAPRPEQAGETVLGVPAMPVIRPGERWSESPFPLVDGGRYTIGWQYFPDHQGGPSFVTLRRNALGMLAIVARYPLTEQGWSSAWQSLMSLEPAAAERTGKVLRDRAKIRDDRARRESDAPQPAGTAWPTPGEPKHMPAHPAPAMPIIRPGERRSESPFALVDGGRYMIGWQYFPNDQGGPSFVTLRRNALGMLAIVARYPLTEQGWTSAWQSLMSLEPAAAERTLKVLANRATTRKIARP
jgi:hypothetical protein